MRKNLDLGRQSVLCPGRVRLSLPAPLHACVLYQGMKSPKHRSHTASTIIYTGQLVFNEGGERGGVIHSPTALPVSIFKRFYNTTMLFCCWHNEMLLQWLPWYYCCHALQDKTSPDLCGHAANTPLACSIDIASGPGSSLCAGTRCAEISRTYPMSLAVGRASVWSQPRR